MRTTVTLDSDVEALLRRRMEERGTSFKVALNDAIRAGVDDAPVVDFHTRTQAMGAPSIEFTSALRLAGDLEDEEIVAKLRAGR